MSHSDNLFSVENNSLIFDNVDLKSEIADVYGTPTYIFSSRKIHENIKELSEAFKSYYPDTKIAYSTKNNLLPEITALIADKLDYFETTSLLELKLIEKISLQKRKPLNVISSNLFKPDGLIKELVEYPNSLDEKIASSKAGSIIAVDSFQDLKNIERVVKEQEKKAKVVIRVNPGIKMSREKTIFASAYPDAKCASIIYDIKPILDASENPNINKWLLKRAIKPKYDFAERIIEEAFNSEYIELLGIHGHIGSQITNLEYYDHFFEVITLFYKLMEEKFGHKFTHLDLGGGYPVKYTSDTRIPSVKDIARSISSYIKNAQISPRLIIESGRFITATSAILLSEVNITKENPSGSKIGILDLSVYSDLLDIITAKWQYDYALVNNLPGNESSNNVEWELVGATNDTLDQLSPMKTIFPRDIKLHDLIAIKNVGAYTTCFNSNYCGRPKPLALILDSNNPHKIVIAKRF